MNKRKITLEKKKKIVKTSYENLKQHTRHSKLLLESSFSQIHLLVPEKSGSQDFMANWSD